MSNIDQKELALRYIINHIFLPPGLPQQDDYTLENDRVLCEELLSSARHYRSKLLSADNVIRWDPMLTMLHNLHEFHNEDGLSKDRVKVAMTKMQPGGMLCFYILQNNKLTAMTRVRCLSAPGPCPKRGRHFAEGQGRDNLRSV